MKNLFTLILFCCSFALLAQYGQGNYPAQEPSSPKYSGKSKSEVIRTKNFTAIPMGHSINPWTVAGAARQYLNANHDLGLISFVRRGGNDDTVGTTFVGDKLYLHYSFNHGSSMQKLSTPLYNNQPAGAENRRARYPQGLIWNPPGNTNPSKAYQMFFAPSLISQGWGGFTYGFKKFSLNQPGKSYQEPSDVGVSRSDATIDASLYQKPDGTVLHVECERNASTGIYSGRVIVTKFNLDTVAQEMNSTISTLMALPTINCSPCNIIFNPKVAFDATGTVGYISLLGRLGDTLIYPDRTHFPMFFKTLDGGATWRGPYVFNINDNPGLVGLRNALGGDFEMESGVMKKRIYAVYFDYNMTVDGYGRMHIATTFGYAGTRNANNPANRPAYLLKDGVPVVLAHIYEKSDGTFAYNVLSRPDEIRGMYDLGYISNWGQINGVQATSRVQFSQSDDKNQFVFAWLETASDRLNSIPPFLGIGNVMPDLKIAGFDLRNPNSTRYIPKSDLTQGTAISGKLHWMGLSKRLYRQNNRNMVPLSISILDEPYEYICDQGITHYYLNGVSIDDTLYTTVNPFINFDNNPITITSHDVTDLLAGHKATGRVKFYPNPVQNLLQIDASEWETQNLHYEIMDATGRVVQSGQLKGGENNGVEINVQSGAYLFKLTAPHKTVVNRIAVIK